MTNKLMFDRLELEKTENLDEAVQSLFSIKTEGRACLFNQEAMNGDLARSYHEMGLRSRFSTYRDIARDFRTRTECYTVRPQSASPDVGTILDVGCGSGLLSIELAKETSGKILGIDLSEDMIALARDNLAKYPELEDRVEFRQGSVYDLRKLASDKEDIKYVVCRNALHRFSNPDKALSEMLFVLNPSGKMYIRDLRRDADWRTVLARIGEPRWQRSELVIDYIGAMKQMLKVDELESILDKLSISEYRITKGDYQGTDWFGNLPKGNLQEYASEVEYVCVAKKQDGGNNGEIKWKI